MHKIMILCSIVMSIPACYAADRGSIPRQRPGSYFFSAILNDLFLKRSKIFLMLTFVILGSRVASINACHAVDWCSIPH